MLRLPYVVLILGLTTCSTEAVPEQEAVLADPASANVPTAVEVAEALKASGVPLSYDITPADGVIKPSPSAGILSSANTATDSADISVTVFQSPQHRREAIERQEKVQPGFAQHAECGPIKVDVMDGRTQGAAPPHVVDLAKQVRAVLETRYGPCEQ